MRGLISVFAVSGLMLGCGGATGDDTGDDVPPGVVDVRVEIPEPDPRYTDLVTPEVQIEPGEERMYCYHLDNTAEFSISTMEALQGQFGHHIVLATTIAPEPAGTLRDCTAWEDSWKLRAFVLPLDLPPGHGIKVPAGLQFVMQFHYVNTGEAPILVRDVARLHNVEPTAVERWVATMTTHNAHVAIPPGPMSASFDCTLEQDFDLLLLGGHMHELGTRFSVDVGPSVSELENVYLVDPWQPSYRDAPPISMFFSNPMHLAAGTVVRTRCEWMNTGSSSLMFPAEMCAGFGYMAGSDTPFHCEAE